MTAMADVAAVDSGSMPSANNKGPRIMPPPMPNKPPNMPAVVDRAGQTSSVRLAHFMSPCTNRQPNAFFFLYLRNSHHPYIREMTIQAKKEAAVNNHYSVEQTLVPIGETEPAFPPRRNDSVEMKAIMNNIINPYFT